MKAPVTKLLAAGAALVALAPLLAGCGTSSTGSSDTLTVGFVVDPSWAQVPVAQDLGYFKRHGVKVKVVDFPTGVEALQAVAAGQVDVTTAADVPAAAALTRTPSVRVVADGSRWNGSRIVARRSAGITSAADLAGKRIGTPLGTSAEYFATSALARAGVHGKLVQVAPGAMVTAASRRNVDAVSIFQPYQQQVVAALGKDAVEIPGSYSQHSLYLASSTAVRSKAKALRGFFAALTDAGGVLTKRSAPAVAAVAKATQLDPTLLKQVLPEFDYTLRLDPSLAGTLNQLGGWAKSQGSIDGSTPVPDYAKLLDRRFLATGT